MHFQKSLYIIILLGDSNKGDANVAELVDLHFNIDYCKLHLYLLSKESIYTSSYDM